MAENEIEGTALGIAWDGTGLGTDGTIWGGEFLKITEDSFERAGHMRSFRLPGSEKAIREPRRAALGILHKIYGSDAFQMKDLAPVKEFSPSEIAVLKTMLEDGIQSPVTSSAGRLFDAAASILGLQQVNHFEGQAAMALEFLADSVSTEEAYPVQLRNEKDGFIIDWATLFKSLIEDISKGIPANIASAKFHNALAHSAVLAAKKVGEQKVVLSGGCFQNRLLLERTVTLLKEYGFKVYWHQRIPTNDGGISVGQAAALARMRISACA
jgi:hydrogenase maturation protein HypF